MALNANEILAIVNPKVLFGNNAKAAYHTLVKIWHPDISGRNDVFQHISNLYQQLSSSVADNFLYHDTKADKSYRFHFASKIQTDTGFMYVGAASLCFQFDDGFVSKIENYRRPFQYKNERMQEEFERYLPNVIQITDKHCVIKKPAKTFPLREILDKFNGKIDPHHVAWVISRLLNINCFLKFAGISHNAINIDALFISPEMHFIYLLGGWEFSTSLNETLKTAPLSTVTYSNVNLYGKKADGRIDGELIKAVGLQLLGDNKRSTPSSMLRWLNDPVEVNSIKMYKNWESVLVTSFGPRKFIKMEV